MPSGVRVPPTSAPFTFDVLDCKSVGAASAPVCWRLAGRTPDGRRLLLDLDVEVPAGPVGAVAAPPSVPSRLTHATVTPVAQAATVPATATATASGTACESATAVAGEGRRSWVIEADQGRFDLGPSRLFVHEDVSMQAAIAVPPRPVPLGKRLFWRAVFALLATRAGRRWLERRAAA